MISKAFQQNFYIGGIVVCSLYSVYHLLAAERSDAAFCAILAFQFANAYRIGELETDEPEVGDRPDYPLPPGDDYES